MALPRPPLTISNGKSANGIWLGFFAPRYLGRVGSLAFECLPPQVTVDVMDAPTADVEGVNGRHSSDIKVTVFLTLLISARPLFVMLV